MRGEIAHPAAYSKSSFFFTVKAAEIEQIERLQAMNMVEFAALVDDREWRWSTDIDGVTPG